MASRWGSMNSRSVNWLSAFSSGPRIYSMKDLIEMDFGAKNWLVEGDYTDVRKAEKLEGFGLPLLSPLSILGRERPGAGSSRACAHLLEFVALGEESPHRCSSSGILASH